MKDTEFIAQLAQFSSLEKLTDIAQSMNKERPRIKIILFLAGAYS